VDEQGKENRGYAKDFHFANNEGETKKGSGLLKPQVAPFNRKQSCRRRQKQSIAIAAGNQELYNVKNIARLSCLGDGALQKS
jgi:hypothetical protein